MTFCNICNESVSGTANFCAKCGSPLLIADRSQTYRYKRRNYAAILVTLVVLCLVLAIGLSLIEYTSSEPVIIKSRAITVPQNYATIQEAIDAARDGDIIDVEPGAYYENIDFNGKNITLRSINPDDPEIVASTIIDGGGKGPVVKFVSSEGALAILSGFTITGGSESGIIVAKESSPQITNNNITGNRYSKRGTGGGMTIKDNSSPLIARNTVSDNFSTSGGGIHVTSSYPIIEDNLIINNNNEKTNTFLTGGGLYIYKSEVAIKGNTITGNYGSRGSAIFIMGVAVSSVHLEANNIYDNPAHELFGHMDPFGVAIMNEGVSLSFDNNYIRPDHGALIIGKRLVRSYLTDLKVDNDLPLDAVVVIVDKSQRNPVTRKAVYMRSGNTYEIGNLSFADAEVYFMLGDNWDPQNNRFVNEMSYHRFDYNFDFSGYGSYYDITLHGVPGGTLRAEALSENEFPRLK